MFDARFVGTIHALVWANGHMTQPCSLRNRDVAGPYTGCHGIQANTSLAKYWWDLWTWGARGANHLYITKFSCYLWSVTKLGSLETWLLFRLLQLKHGWRAHFFCACAQYLHAHAWSKLALQWPKHVVRHQAAHAARMCKQGYIKHGRRGFQTVDSQEPSTGPYSSNGHKSWPYVYAV